MSLSVLPMFSSKSSIVSGLTFRALVHLSLSVYSIKKYSSFIHLHVAVQFSQHHLLKRLSLPHCIFLPPWSHGFISGLSILFLVCISVFVPVPYCLDDCSFVV